MKYIVTVLAVVMMTACTHIPKKNVADPSKGKGGFIDHAGGAK